MKKKAYLDEIEKWKKYRDDFCRGDKILILRVVCKSDNNYRGEEVHYGILEDEKSQEKIHHSIPTPLDKRLVLNVGDEKLLLEIDSIVSMSPISLSAFLAMANALQDVFERRGNYHDS